METGMEKSEKKQSLRILGRGQLERVESKDKSLSPLNRINLPL